MHGFNKIILALLRRLLYFFSIPSALVLVIIYPIIKIRIIGLQSFRIGHYALTTELMLCALDLENAPRNKITIFYNMSPVCNVQLYKMWKRVIPIFPFSRLAIQVDQVLSLILGSRYKNDKIKKTYESCDTGTIDKDAFLKKVEKPHLSFTQKENDNAKILMKKMGIPDDAKFICLVVRDAVYLNKQYPENDWSYHDHRNADIECYKKSAIYLAEKGYYVLRMGKFVNKEFNCDHPKIIDYANHPLRSDFMDVYLSAHCFFCISTCTGLDCVSQIFRKPVLLTNISPVFAETLMWYPCTLFIPKMLKNTSTNQFLPLSETNKICASLSSRDILAEFKKLDLILTNNDENQILEVVREMEARMLGLWNETPMQQDQQSRYWQHQKNHRPIPVNNIYIKIGSNYLQENTILLQ